MQNPANIPTWHDHLESKRRLLVSGIVTICFAILAVTALRDPYSYDIYWHIQTAVDWMDKGLSPWVDHFSYTYEQHAISGQPIVFQISVAKLVQNFGLEPGLQIFKFVSFSVATCLFIAFMHRLKSSVSAYLLALPLFVVLIQLRSITRPELISYSFSILAVMLYFRAKGRVTPNNIIPMALLMFIWSNYHSSILGYVILFGFFIDAAIIQLKEKLPLKIWIMWFLWGCLILAVGFLNPSLQHPILDAISFAPEWKSLIQEYENSSLYRNVPPVYILGLIAAGTISLAFTKKLHGMAIATFILTFNAIQTSRLVTPAGIIVLCFFIWLLSEINIKRMVQSRSRPKQLTICVTLSIVFLMTMIYAVNFARAAMEENKTSALRLPGSIVRYMSDKGLSGRIFNTYEVGGYLTYKLSPDSSIYIDGRTNILYPVEHYLKYLESKNSPEVFNAEIDTYGIDYAILGNERRSFMTTHDSGKMSLDYSDANFSLFVRNNSPTFPTAGQLLARPACWSESMTDQLELEQNKALFDLPSSSILTPYLIFLNQYSHKNDKKDYVKSLSDSPPEDENISRFLAYQSLSLGEYESALSFLKFVSDWDFGEYLLAAIARVQKGEFTTAESLLDEATRIGWSSTTEGEKILLLKLIKEVHTQLGSSVFERDYIRKLEENLSSLKPDFNDLNFDPMLFCPNL